MQIGRALAIVALGSTAASAAPTAAELQAHGEALAQERRYTEAIEAFKAADKLEPTAAHMCLIGLAYTRRELWPQAEIFMARCHVLAVTERLPDWVPDADALIRERIGQATVAEIEFAIEPADAPVELSVSSFAPDETFTPAMKIHLHPGHHVITAMAPGFELEHQSIDIADKTPRVITIKMYRTGKRPKPPSPLPHAMIVGGVVTLGAGAVAYGVMGIGWLALSDRGTNHFGGAYQTMYEYGRPISISLFAVGAGLAIAGLALRHGNETAPVAAFAPMPGGGMLALQWSR